MPHTAIKIVDSIYISKMDMDVPNTIQMFEHDIRVVEQADGKFHLTANVHSFANQSKYELDCCNVDHLVCCRAFDSNYITVVVDPSQITENPITLFLNGLRAGYNETEVLQEQ